MTEQKPSSAAQPGSHSPRPEWPAYSGDAGVGDPAIDAMLVRLGALPELPVAAHGEVYAGLHDELVEALNEDVAGQAPGNRRP